MNQENETAENMSDANGVFAEQQAKLNSTLDRIARKETRDPQPAQQRDFYKVLLDRAVQLGFQSVRWESYDADSRFATASVGDKLGPRVNDTNPFEVIEIDGRGRNVLIGKAPEPEQQHEINEPEVDGFVTRSQVIRRLLNLETNNNAFAAKIRVLERRLARAESGVEPVQVLQPVPASELRRIMDGIAAEQQAMDARYQDSCARLEKEIERLTVDLPIPFGLTGKDEHEATIPEDVPQVLGYAGGDLPEYTPINPPRQL